MKIKKNKNQSNVEELKNREKLYFFLTSSKFTEVKKICEPIFLEFKNILLTKDIRKDEDVKWFSDKKEEIDNILRKILRENHLSINFRKSLFKYFYEKEIFVMPNNFTIRVSPVVKMSRDGSIQRYADEVQLVTFAPLSTKEKEQAFKSLQWHWKLCFPLEVSKRTNLRDKDIDRKFSLFQEMTDRKRSAEYEEDSYLKDVKKQFGEKAYKDAKKSNPLMTRVTADKKTSKDIARKLYGTKSKAGAIRTRFSRMRKKLDLTNIKGVTLI